MGYSYHKSLLTTNEIWNLYQSGLTCEEISLKAGIGSVAVWKRLKTAGYSLRTIGVSKGTHWSISKRGKEFLGSDGRWWIRAIPSGKNRNSKRKSVVIMEKILGHAIPRGFIVHHKNGNCTDDREENLELKRKSIHTSEHNILMWKRRKGVTTDENISELQRGFTRDKEGLIRNGH